VITRTRTYFTESYAELRKVAWPTRRTVLNLTAIVIAVSILVGVYIEVIDLAVQFGMQQLLTP
jgi:preprotein translocase subunit SecE